jgi:hypothetical protein
MTKIFFYILIALIFTGCAKDRGLTNDADIKAHNREVALAILCGLAGNKTDSSGKCDYSQKRQNQISNQKPNLRNPSEDQAQTSKNTSSLVYACGSVGMSVNFVTGNCISNTGNEVNPRNVVSPSIKLPQESSSNLIMRCGALGKSSDFVTGRCY